MQQRSSLMFSLRKHRDAHHMIQGSIRHLYHLMNAFVQRRLVYNKSPSPSTGKCRYGSKGKRPAGAHSLPNLPKKSAFLCPNGQKMQLILSSPGASQCRGLCRRPAQSAILQLINAQSALSAAPSHLRHSLRLHKQTGIYPTNNRQALDLILPVRLFYMSESLAGF